MTSEENPYRFVDVSDEEQMTARSIRATDSLRLDCTPEIDRRRRGKYSRIRLLKDTRTRPNTCRQVESLLMASRLLAIAVCVVLLSGCERQQSTTQPRNGVEKIDEREAAADSLATERDLEALQGTWELVSLKRDWVEANEGPCLYEFEGATMTVYPSDMRPSFYTLELNASESPKEMDIIATWEDGSVTKAEVIYDLDGDTFQWCHVDGKRPPAFLSARNRAGTLNVLQRVKAKE